MIKVVLLLSMVVSGCYRLEVNKEDMVNVDKENVEVEVLDKETFVNVDGGCLNKIMK